MSSVHAFIQQIRDTQAAAKYEIKTGGRIIANLIATTKGSSLLMATGDCVIKEALDLLPGSTTLSIGKMATSDRNRSGLDHNVCVFTTPSESGKGEIKTIAYLTPTPDEQYTAQVQAFEAGTQETVVLFSGHTTKGSTLGTELQVQYKLEGGIILIQLLAW